MVIFVAEGSEAKRDELISTHFQPKLLKCVELHSDDHIFIVPLESLCAPCFVVFNKIYCMKQVNVTSDDDIISYINRPQHEWIIFLQPP